ncbi:hypothetical protein KIH74_22805 [Kineosporia sp. J2-2]|uniref:Uncharacterized protein n=1 Tax=Kineosporia corallincola TaxID=2835133 RepID=A0ABS5TQA6_9ACTN|nr:hypothetical protein [Kineosporia corallincola]MBT0771789.1 hypothetical protein [Kineosporia corallincola]
MSHPFTSPVTTPGNADPSSGRSGRGYSADHPASKPSKARTISAGLGAAAALTIATAAFSALGSGDAHAATIQQARVKDVPAVQATQGPIRVPSGKLRCTRPGQWHATVHVTTTGTTKAGTHIASVQVQYQHGGRSTLAGQASSKKRTVPVTFCISPSQVEGGRGPIRGIASDVMEGGHSRSFIIRFSR